MLWRTYLIEWPARVVDRVMFAYWTLIAALTILCFVNVGLWVLAYLLGFRLP